MLPDPLRIGCIGRRLCTIVQEKIKIMESNVNEATQGYLQVHILALSRISLQVPIPEPARSVIRCTPLAPNTQKLQHEVVDLDVLEGVHDVGIVRG